MIEGIIIEKGKIVYDEFHYSKDKSLEDQYLELKEDMLQIEYGSYLIDIGRYGPWDKEGRFIIYLIYNKNRENPLDKIICETYDKLVINTKKIIQEFELNPLE